MKNIILKFLLIILISSSILIGNLVRAQDVPIKTQGGSTSELCAGQDSMDPASDYCLTAPIPLFGSKVNIAGEGLGTYINKAISLTISLAALLAVIMIIVYGIKYMIKDTPLAVGSAKSGIKNSLIGLFLVMSAYLILKTINPNLVEFNLDISATANLIEQQGVKGNTPTGNSSSNPNDSNPDFVNGNQIIGSCPVYNPKAKLNPNNCTKYDAYIKNNTSDPSMQKLLKAKVIEESSCGTNEQSSMGACGPFQFLPATAQQFAKDCGVDKNVVTCSWLKNDANEDKATCLAAKYFEMTKKVCGPLVQNWIAAYNAGTNACKLSNSCSQMTSCLNSDGPRQWECIYDNKSHTLYNTGYNETREAVKKVMYLIDKITIN